MQTRILVTHGISYLPQVDHIVVLKEGRVSEVGTYRQLLDQNGAFADFLRTYLTEEVEEETGEITAAGGHGAHKQIYYI